RIAGDLSASPCLIFPKSVPISPLPPPYAPRDPPTSPVVAVLLCPSPGAFARERGAGATPGARRRAAPEKGDDLGGTGFSRHVARRPRGAGTAQRRGVSRPIVAVEGSDHPLRSVPRRRSRTDARRPLEGSGTRRVGAAGDLLVR